MTESKRPPALFRPPVAFTLDELSLFVNSITVAKFGDSKAFIPIAINGTVSDLLKDIQKFCIENGGDWSYILERHYVQIPEENLERVIEICVKYCAISGNDPREVCNFDKVSELSLPFVLDAPTFRKIAASVIEEWDAFEE